MKFRSYNDTVAQAAAASECLALAWKAVRSAAGGSGVDRETVQTFEARKDSQLARVSTELLQGRYRFSKLKCALLPKPNGKLRRLGIPTVGDRVVLQAIRQVIEPACEAKMLDCSHAYRPGRGAMTAMATVAASLAAGRSVVLETDIQSFFDSIRHALLLKQLEAMEPLSTGSRLVADSLKLSSTVWAARKGVAQGSPLSPLLANVALTSFDQALKSKHWTVVRYADDLIILCKSPRAADEALQQVVRELEKLGLAIHPGKTQIVDSRQAEFSFLGFEFHPDRLAPDAENIAKLRDGIDGLCNPHTDVVWQKRIEQINALLRSFAWYYHQTDSRRLFWTLDQHVADRLNELETHIGHPKVSWENQVVKMSTMREVNWLGSGKRSSSKGKRRSTGWNGYGG